MHGSPPMALAGGGAYTQRSPADTALKMRGCPTPMAKLPTILTKMKAKNSSSKGKPRMPEGRKEGIGREGRGEGG